MGKQHFVILTSGRSGSTLLVEALRGAGVAAYGELLHDEADVRREHTFGEVTPIADGQEGSAFLQSFFAGERTTGFKLFYEQARIGPSASAWDYLVEHREIAVVHLVRRDLLAAWVSYEVARRSGVWTRSRGAPLPPPVEPFEIDPEELSAYFDRVTAQRSWARRAFRHHAFFELGYERGLRARYGPTIADVLAFLQAPGSAPVEPPQAPLLRRPLHEQVVNLQALRDRFRATPYEALLPPLQASPSARETHPGFCPRPFEFLGVDAKGKLRVCCEDWLPTPIGDVREGNLQEQWNSHTAEAIRESILDGSYRYCDRAQCPDLVRGSLVPLEKVRAQTHQAWARTGATILANPPATLSLGYDPTCNLKCPTCRSDFISLEGSAFEDAAVTQKIVLEAFLGTARTVIVTGHGDAIASRLYRRFLRTFDASVHPGVKILLMTNGLTLDADMWASFASAHGAISGVSISVDAATPETYEVNRGGSFLKLRRNLAFLGGLHREGLLDFLEISFVVQTNNFHEMPAFVQLAREMGCSTVLFMKFIHWPGTFDEDEAQKRSVHLETHPLHAAFLRVLADPSLGDPDIDLSNLASLRAPLLTSPRDLGT